jgi:hypothetical protein
MHFPLGSTTDKAALAKSVLHQSQAPKIQRPRHASDDMRLLTIFVLVGILLVKAASGAREPDWETC